MNVNWSEVFGSEWEWVVKLGSAISDPEEKKSFWEGIKQRKLSDPSYSIYQDFPRSETVKKNAMMECCDFVRSLRAPKKEEETA